jgi:hypothetical protein
MLRGPRTEASGRARAGKRAEDQVAALAVPAKEMVGFAAQLAVRAAT